MNIFTWIRWMDETKIFWHRSNIELCGVLWSMAWRKPKLLWPGFSFTWKKIEIPFNKWRRQGRGKKNILLLYFDFCYYFDLLNLQNTWMCNQNWNIFQELDRKHILKKCISSYLSDPRTLHIINRRSQPQLSPSGWSLKILFVHPFTSKIL